MKFNNVYEFIYNEIKYEYQIICKLVEIDKLRLLDCCNMYQLLYKLYQYLTVFLELQSAALKLIKKFHLQIKI